MIYNNTPAPFKKGAFSSNCHLGFAGKSNLSKSFNSFLEWILDLRKELEIPHKLSDVIDINKLDIDELSEMALNDPSTASNPKTLTISDMKIIYKNSISGELFK